MNIRHRKVNLNNLSTTVKIDKIRLVVPSLNKSISILKMDT